jgi:hypothetical protein
MNVDDPDAAPDWQMDSPTMEGRMALNAQLPMAPSGWRVREALSYDLPYLWPAEYESTVERFERASRDERDAFLRRSGVRWCAVNGRQERPWPVVATVANWEMRVYECHPAATRVAFAPVLGTVEDLFTPTPGDAGDAGDARLTEDGPTRVEIDATVPRQTYLVLRDSYDPSWYAEVDGRPVSVLRAFGIQRAVPLGPGHHVVRFSYRPRDWLAGLTLSVVGCVILGLWTWRTNAASR